MRGRGRHHDWLLLAFALPAIRLCISAAFRRQFGRCLRYRARQIVRFRRGGPVPWLATFQLVVLPATAMYLWSSHSLRSHDTEPVMQIATSLVTDGDWCLDEFYPDVLAGKAEKPYDIIWRDGRLYSGYQPGMVQFALPVAAVSRLIGAELHLPKVRARLEKFTAAWLAGASMGLFFILALHLGSLRAAAWMTFAVAVGSTMLTTNAQALWQHDGVVFWSVVLLLVEFRQSRAPLRGGTFLQGAACALMLTCRLSSAVIVAPLGLWIVWRSWRRAAGVAAVGSAIMAAWLLLNVGIYGDLRGAAAAQLGRSTWTSAIAVPLMGVLLSPARGLFVYQPWLIIALLPALPTVRRRLQNRIDTSSGRKARPAKLTAPSGWAWPVLAAALLQIIMVACWKMWWGGHCWGSRLLADVIPLSALLCVAPAQILLAGRGSRAVLASLIVLSLAVQLPGVWTRAFDWNAKPTSIDENPARLWSWRDAPFLHVRDD